MIEIKTHRILAGSRTAARRRTLGFGVLLAAALCAPSLMADEWQYTYAGNNFTSYLEPFTGSDKVAVVMDLNGQLSANISNYVFSTTDGITLTAGPLQLGAFPGESLSAEEIGVTLSTDAYGNITAWNIDANYGHGAELIRTSSSSGDFTVYFNTASNSSPGTWTAEDLNPPAATPEPGTVSMMLGGVLLCLGAARRKSQAL